MRLLALLGAVLILLLAACDGSDPATEQPPADRPESTPTATMQEPDATATESTSRISSADFIATVTAAAAPTDHPTSTVTPAAPPTPSPTSSAPEPTREGQPTAEPESDDARGPFTIIEVRGAPPGQTASLTVEVAPGTACTLAYTTPSGTESQAAGLGEATAGDDGRITWEWVIGSRTNPGEGTIQVRCGDATETRPMTIE